MSKYQTRLIRDPLNRGSVKESRPKSKIRAELAESVAVFNQAHEAAKDLMAKWEQIRQTKTGSQISVDVTEKTAPDPLDLP